MELDPPNSKYMDPEPDPDPAPLKIYQNDNILLKKCRSGNKKNADPGYKYTGLAPDPGPQS